MKKHTIEFSKITQAKKLLESAAATVAGCESKIVIAERTYEEARRDDGVSAPVEIFNRGESARRDLEVLKIEGNRAAAKLAEAEEGFAALVRGNAQPIIDHLREISRTARERILAAVTPILGKPVCESPSFHEALKISPEINEPFALANRIQMSLDMEKGHSRKPGDPISDGLVSNILSAERFF